MSILIDQHTRLLIQGITGREGRFHARQCLDYGTRVVAGVTPGKGGRKVEGVAVFDTVREAARETGADCSLVFVPPASAAAAILEAAEAGIPLVIAITEGIPVHDLLRLKSRLAGGVTRLIGPNCPGIISPGKCKAGIMPGEIHLPGGPVGVVSRSGTLTYEAVSQLSRSGLGQTTCIGIGGDPVVGTSFVEVLAAFEEDPDTGAVLLVGEIGGSAEEEAAGFIREHFSKPVAAFIAGLSAPPGRRMGHAGAIVSNGRGTAGAKIEALRAAGVRVCRDLASLGDFCAAAFQYKA